MSRKPISPIDATQPGSAEVEAVDPTVAEAEPERPAINPIGDTQLGSQPGSGPASATPLGPANPTTAPFPVVRWDRYDFIRPLGQGAMGTVFLAQDKELDRVVALKFIRGGDSRLMARLQQEARAQARIDHPNICKISVGCGNSDGIA